MAQGEGFVRTGAPEIRSDYHGFTRENVLAHVPRLGGTLLDVGGGVGAAAVRLRELGAADRVGVIDMVDSRGIGKTDFCYAGDIEDEAFIANVISAEGPFRVILCLDILEHLVDPWRLVAQLHHALEVDGVIVASIPNVRCFRALLPLLFKNQWTLRDAGILDRTHLRFFVRSTAIELMTSSGLELVSVHPSRCGGRKVRLFRILTLGLLNSFTDLQYIVCVRRPNT